MCLTIHKQKENKCKFKMQSAPDPLCFNKHWIFVFDCSSQTLCGFDIKQQEGETILSS